MERCKGCGRMLGRNDPGRRQWCRDIRSLFVLSNVRPEDYHPNCFLDALIENRTASLVDATAPEPGEPALAATAESQPPGWW
jgi:hypothetical protein